MLLELTLDLQIVQTNRVGQTRPKGTTDLVKFENALNLKLLLKCKSKLRSLDKWKKVLVNSDLTKSQQIQMNSLRETLRQRRKYGVFNSVIKYIKDVPKNMFKKLINYFQLSHGACCILINSNTINKNKCYNCNKVLVNKLKTLLGNYQNVIGLRTKLNILRFHIPLFNFNYFVLTETWLSVDVILLMRLN